MTPEAQAALHAKCFTTPRPWSAAEFASLAPSSFTLSHPHGFLLGRVVADEAELLTLAVDPAARRQGIARHLVETFKSTAAAQGASTAFLEVAADNTAAIALYRATGFEPAGRRRGYYRRADAPALDALVLRCAIDTQ
ncbi:GNAT family N-acetyltransferase [Litoreibacter albidus]|uniref:GNAT family N-acetyltransferase n=1 Tax=Litoreibacter albidus TaxID=670155 RepID=UPI0037355CC7